MDKNEHANWSSLTYEQKNHQLFWRQKEFLNSFLEKGAIVKA